MQSPIDLSSRTAKIVRKFQQLRRNYFPCNASLENRGHDILVYWDRYKAEKVKINGTDYYLQKIHWHSPSEHTIKGKRYSMELHLVHVSKNYKIAVLGILYKIGSPDSFLSKLTKNVETVGDNKQEKKIGIMDPREIKIKGKKYFRYIGSLTIPPCTQGVIWTINKRVQTVSRHQLKTLKAAVHDSAKGNSRPLQPLNHREIDLYTP
ncbi:PREDICTED: alpha carbonic anhydrase 7-like [Tarenaya hassleriana]|uniref:alpha carbonic anhydrase 7-like n=1 Tax=Tarenaya hassleriana TaxID=28532 RepID=UPI00053C6C02|nr:PREDICTED: alpha carbonic anhydrase 7-like [Tarenaya hassleriana]